MKRNHLIFAGLLVTLLFFMASCEKIGKKPSLIGQWEVIKLEVFVYNGEDLVSQDTYPSEFFLMEFKDNGTLTIFYDENDLTDNAVTNWSHTTDPVEEGDHIDIEGDDVTIEALTERTLIFSVWESATDLLKFTLKKVE